MKKFRRKTMPASPKSGLGSYLAFVLSISSLLLTVILIGVIGLTASQELKKTIGSSLGERALYATEKLDTSMFERYREVQNLARTIESTVSTTTPIQQRAMLELVQATYPNYAWIGTANTQGKVVAATGGLLEGIDVSQRHWFRDAFAGVYVQDVHDAKLLAKLLPTASGDPLRFVDIAFPYRDQRGAIIGVLSTHLSWEWAKETRDLIAIEDRDKTDFLIVARDGIVLLGPDDLQGKRIDTPSFQAAKERRTGYMTEKWPDGKTYLVGFSKTAGYKNYPGLGWTVLTRQNDRLAYVPVFRMQVKVFWSGLAIAGLFTLLGVLVARQISQPILRVAEAAKSVESGNASLIVDAPGAYFEVKALTGALNSLLSKLRHNEQVLTDVNAGLELRVSERTDELKTSLEAVKGSEMRLNAIIATAQDAFIGMDNDKCILQWNVRAEIMFGYRSDEVVGRLLGALIAPTYDIEHFHTSLNELFAQAGQQAGQRLALSARRRDGSVFPIEVTVGQVIFEGQILFNAFISDISARQAAERALEAERGLLNAVLESIDMGVVACDQHGMLTLFNRASRDFHGMPQENLPAESWAQHYRLFEVDGATPLATENNPLVRTLAGETVKDMEMVIAPLNQSPRLMQASGRILLDGQNNHLGAVVVMSDITARRAVEQNLAQSEKLLRTITDGIPARVAYIDARLRHRFCNANYANTATLTPAQMVNKTIREIFGDQAYAALASNMARAIRGEQVAFDHQAKENDIVRYLHHEYTPDIGVDGRVMGFFMLVTDITTIKEAQLQIAGKERLLRGVTDHLPALVSFIDLDERFQFNNAPYEDWFKKPLSSITGQTLSEIYGDEFDQFRERYHLAVQGNRQDFEFVSSRLRPDRHYSATYMPQLDNDGCVIGVCSMIRDTTDLKLAEEQMRLLARVDTLTGLPNRIQYQERLAQAIDRTQRNGKIIGLLFLDIDKFKAVNDSLGHRGGDMVLKEFGKRLLSCIRKTDMVARLAGDEFVIILEEMRGGSEAIQICEKIIQAMRPPFMIEGTELIVSTSIGAAQSDDAMIDAEMLLHRADEALYKAKAAGRNTFVLSQDEKTNNI